MSEPFLSELRIFTYNFAPKGWAMCNGQLLSIAQNTALFSLLGTNYGGDGRVNFGLPNLMGRTPMDVGTGFTQGQSGGEANHTLIATEMPQHIHQAVASSNSPSAGTPANNFWDSNSGHKPYAASPNQTMAATALGNAGGSQPHPNMSPYLVLNICIATVGIFPSRN